MQGLCVYMDAYVIRAYFPGKNHAFASLFWIKVRVIGITP